tara:strand:- start:626 stop:772 length:147 start_codon:yes stop_codon:yes gene_type:complete
MKKELIVYKPKRKKRVSSRVIKAAMTVIEENTNIKWTAEQFKQIRSAL